jgi:sulfur transfer complex TusBCD TusB component (DsrH family)
MKAVTANRYIERIREAQSKRDWSKLPAQYEQQTANNLAKKFAIELKDIDSTGTVSIRIALAKAVTFDSLATLFTKYTV